MSVGVLARIQTWPIPLQRALAVTALSLCALMATALVIVPAHTVFRAHDAWAQEAQRALAQHRGRLAEAPMLEQWQVALTATPAEARLLSARKGETPVEILTALVRGAFARAGVLDVNVKPLGAAPPEHVGAALNAYRVQATSTVSADALARVLKEIGASTTYLRVLALSATSPPQQHTEQNPPIVLTLEIAGFSAGANGSAQ
jgi:hypothetical protein